MKHTIQKLLCLPIFLAAYGYYCAMI
uniref:Uncharacterized protein n=1 Tax=Anguilla anguilla TaxID=7936 RepID=A0A0E9ULC6_ANGAN